MTLEIGDARKQRTRQAIHRAFFDMVQQQRYYEIKIDTLVARAGIARSTFYEHFKSKDALLASSLEGPFSRLANLVKVCRMQATDESAGVALTQASDIRKAQIALIDILSHFWQNRALARSIFIGALRKKVGLTLAAMIYQRLEKTFANKNLPLGLVSIQLSEMMLAPIVAWLLGEAQCSAEVLGDMLVKSVAGAMSALGRKDTM
jgi:AcrR family transcriptional regulator